MIGNFILLRRKELGISRKDLAKDLGITYNYLNLIETNKRKVSKKLLNKVAEKLDISTEELIYYNTIEGENAYKVEEKVIEKQIKNLTKDIARIDLQKSVLTKERELLISKLAIVKNAKKEIEQILQYEKD